jgi:prolyl-tRNA synthetase
MSMFAKWIQSYRDLPLLMNQWANVVRWELRTRLFLRTSEFLWQEGHTVHATGEDAEEHTLRMLGVYRTFMEDWMAMPPVTGLKSDAEKFAGAVRSYSCEAMMQDNRALQAGTSHFLGQNFSKQFDLTFQSKEGKEEYGWSTSWGVSTRLVGGLVMTHGDDTGLVLPPKLAPTQVVIVPILKGDDVGPVLEKAEALRGALADRGVRAKVDAREHLNPGNKYYEWERKGVPLRMEIGPRDMEQEQVVLAKRVRSEEEPRKEFLPEAEALATIPERLDAFQAQLLEAAKARREDNSYRGVQTIGELAEIMDASGGYVYTGWSGDPAVEERVKEETKATLRCIPEEEFRSAGAPSKCIGGNGDATKEVVWAKSY